MYTGGNRTRTLFTYLRRYREDVHGDSGSVLISILAVSLCAVAVAATIDTVALYQLRIARLQQRTLVTSWMSRSVAMQALRDIHTHQLTVGRVTYHTPFGSVSQVVTADSSLWTVITCAQTETGGVGTRFAVSRSSDTVTLWQDGTTACS